MTDATGDTFSGPNWRSHRWWILAAAALFMVACGDARNVSITGGSGGGGGGGDDDESSRYEQLEPLGLEPGEAAEGIHLQPGIEQITIDEDVAHHATIDEASETVTFSDYGRRYIENQVDEIWTDDILIVDGAIFLIEDVEEVGDELVIHVRPFVLLDVIHGDWNIDFSQPQSTILPRLSTNPNADVEADLGDIVDNLSAKQELEVTASGHVKFPSTWEGSFDGRVQVGRCVRSRFRLWGGSRDQADAECFELDHILAKGELGIDVQAGVTLESTTTVEYDDSEKINLGPGGQSPRVPLGATGLALYVQPYLEGGLKADIQGALQASLEAGVNASIPLGFEYTEEDGFSLLPNENHRPDTGGDLAWDVTGQVSASSDIYNKLGIELVISDALTSDSGLRLVGPKGWAQVGQDMNFEPFGSGDEPCLTGDFYAEAGFQLLLRGEVKWRRWTLGIDIANYSPSPWRYIFDSFAEDLPICETPEPQSLDVTLTWDDPTLLDLNMVTPEGNLIHYGDNMADGGQYTSVSPGDDCLDDNSECTATIDWNIDETTPPEGEYRIWVSAATGEAPADFTVTVENEQGMIDQFTGSVEASANDTSPDYTFMLGER